MDVGLEKLNYSFCDKPLLIGGKAMEYYGLRPAGADIDLVVSRYDHDELRKRYPEHIKDIYGDIGICEYGFEIWNQICRFDYDCLKTGAVEERDLLVVSLEKLLFLKALAIEQEKCYRDVRLIVKEILRRQYE